MIRAPFSKSQHIPCVVMWELCCQSSFFSVFARCHGKIRDISVICTDSSTADFVYVTFPELFDYMACVFSEIVTSERFLRTAMHERRSVEEFLVDTTARHANCYIFPLNLLNQYFTGSRFFHHNRFCVLL